MERVTIPVVWSVDPHRSGRLTGLRDLVALAWDLATDVAHKIAHRTDIAKRSFFALGHAHHSH